ncbi:MAG: hypothetical protein ABI388_00640 [Bacteroidia bacterium]
MKKLIALSLLAFVAISSCKKDTKNTTTPPPTTTTGPQLKFVFKFDSTQDRLDGFGNTSTLPSNHRAQSPHFNGLSAHYIEMTKNNLTAIGAGTVLYTTPTVVSSAVTVGNGTGATATYTDAIQFSQENVVGNGQQFYSIPLSQVAAGTYPYIRISVAYQNYSIKYAIKSGTTVGSYTVPQIYNTGTIASFIGYNSYITSYKIKNQTVAVNGAKQQGYWAFEADPYMSYTYPYIEGQAPQGATTVVSPAAFATTAIPPGSCLVTGQFVAADGTTTKPLTITGNETSDIVITISMSTNQSFEWKYNASNPNDGNIYTLNGDTVVDMGLRGMKPILPN